MSLTKKEIMKHIKGCSQNKAYIIAEIQRLAKDQDPDNYLKIMSILWVYRGEWDKQLAIELIEA